MSDGKPNEVLEHFIERTERSNARRSAIVRAGKRRNVKIALTAAGFAVASYLYTIYAIRRNRYLGESFDQLPSYTPSKPS